MKRLINILLIVLLLCGCSKSTVEKPDFNSGFTIETYKPDMFGYEGLQSSGHRFLGTTVSQLEKTINEKGYGVFVLSYKDCPHCHILMQYINEVAEELDIYVYYIDAYSEKYPILGTDDYDKLFDLIYDICEEVDGEVSMQTPHLFGVVNGKFQGSIIGAKFADDLNPTEKEVEKIKKEYQKIMEPFVN